jgi:hypothetical protein
MRAVFFLFVLYMVASPMISVEAQCSRYVPVNGKCGGVYFCWDSAENCKNELTLLLNVCCVKGTKCVRKNTDEWRCHNITQPLKPSASKPTPKPTPKPSPVAPVQVFSSTMTTLHNYYRKRHQVMPVVWDVDMATQAKQVTNMCSFDTGRLSGDYGQNLFMAYFNQNPIELGKDAVNNWYKAISKYDYNNATFSMDTGTATCVIWKSVKRIGCAVSSCPKSMTYLACLYDPPCNVVGQFEDNIYPMNSP